MSKAFNVLNYFMHELGELRSSLLCTDIDETCPLTMNHYHLALDLLSQARTQLQIAQLHLRKEERPAPPPPLTEWPEGAELVTLDSVPDRSEELCIGCNESRERCECAQFDSERK